MLGQNIYAFEEMREQEAPHPDDAFQEPITRKVSFYFRG
jgi:hypothetical protein